MNAARFIIENFMIAANGTMVDFLGKAGIPMIQRVVRVPRYWDEIVMTAAAYREKLPREPDSKALSLFLLKRKDADPERFPDLSLTIVKLLGPGEYMTLEPGEPPTGHFGLAVTDYTHGTAPNRRYVDLVNQRQLISLVQQTDPAYPPLLNELPGAPAWLYVKGRPEILHRPMLAIVGSRNATPQGRRDAAAFAQHLAESGMTIVSACPPCARVLKYSRNASRTTSDRERDSRVHSSSSCRSSAPSPTSPACSRRPTSPPRTRRCSSSTSVPRAATRRRWGWLR